MEQKIRAIYRLGLSKRMIFTFFLISLSVFFTGCKKEATQSDNVLNATSGTPQVIEEYYGDFFQRYPDKFLVPPEITPSLSLENQRRQLTDIIEERNERAQNLYDASSYVVGYEFSNPLFKKAFPQAHMYAVAINRASTDGRDIFITMVSLGEKDYQMPLDFNQLMVDAGQQITDETVDILAGAFIVAGIPTQMAEQEITCMSGEEIDRTITSVKLIYEIECVVAYQGIGIVTVLFFPFDNLFSSASIGWGSLHESGWRNQGVQFGSRGTEP